MSVDPPHRLVRFRAVLLIIGLGAWAVAFVAGALFAEKPGFPFQGVLALAAIIFIWFNGAYWWLECCYPHVQVAPGKYISRVERSSRFDEAYAYVFFFIYGVLAVFATFVCLRVAAGA